MCCLPACALSMRRILASYNRNDMRSSFSASASISDEVIYVVPSSPSSSLASFLFACPGNGAARGVKSGRWESGRRRLFGPGHARVVIDLPRILAHRDLYIVFCARGIVSFLFFPNGIVPAQSGTATCKPFTRSRHSCETGIYTTIDVNSYR